MSIDPSTITREFFVTPGGLRVILRTNTYASTLDYFQLRFAEAQKDFPEIQPKGVEVVRYTGERYARMSGIEFNVKTGTIIPDTYKQVSSVIPTA